MTTIQTETPRLASRAEWLTARKALLRQEKDLTYLREVVAHARRQLPRVPIEQDYTFESQGGPVRLADLFGNRSQLLVYHFMFHPDWVEGCRSCSYVADHFDALLPRVPSFGVILAGVALKGNCVIYAILGQGGYTHGGPFFARGTIDAWNQQACLTHQNRHLAAVMRLMQDEIEKCRPA